MTKLLYPKSGIYSSCKCHIDSCARNLSKAMNNCNFDIPNDFVYKNYLYNLGGKIREFYNQTNNLETKIHSSDNNLYNLSNDLLNDVKKMTDIKIIERDRMIY